MPNTPFFSVVVPVYNKGPHIHRCITSVLSQKFDDFELLMVNDASTDNSLEEIQRFSDPRLRILHRSQPGPGGYAARNLGICEAKGRWIAFLDADDEWFPEHLERMAALAEAFPQCQFLSCGWMIRNSWGEQEEPFFRHHRSRGARIISLKEYLTLGIRGTLLGAWPTCCIVVCVRNNRMAVDMFPDGLAQRCGDLNAWLYHLAQSKAMAWSPHLGGTYHIGTVNRVSIVARWDPHGIVRLQARLLPLFDQSLRPLVVRYHNRLLFRNWWFFNARYPLTPLPIKGCLSWKGDVLFCGAFSLVLLLVPLRAIMILRRVARARHWVIQKVRASNEQLARLLPQMRRSA